MIEPALIWMAILGPTSVIMVVLAFVANTYVDKLESYFANSKYIAGVRDTFSGAGLPGKILRTGIVYCVLMFPGAYVRRGLIEIREVRLFPLGMKCLVLVIWSALVLLFFMMVGFRILSYMCGF